MAWFNSTLAYLLPYIPRWLVRPFAAPYVAGETVETALAATRDLNAQGFAVTLDILGEHVRSPELARQVRDAYCELYDRIAAAEVKATISLKLTHLGLELDQELAQENVLAILTKAESHHNFLRIDMENSPYTDVTIDIYRACRDRYAGVGMVLQAYLHRTRADIHRLNDSTFNVRICKGIYRESSEIAYQDREAIRENFIQAVQDVLSGEGTVAIATHDLYLIDTLETWIENRQIPPHRFEFQVLYGVPMGNRLAQLRDKGYTVRIYVPYGNDWFDYSVRRLKENPHIVGYVLNNLLQRRA
jgi:proline dehydrogenase